MKFVEIMVDYPPAELCPYEEYKGKPYFGIKYIENGQCYVGFGTYNPKVFSRYLKEYFIEDQTLFSRVKKKLKVLLNGLFKQ